MAANNYVKGRRREYRAQQILERAGYQTIRAASSKGVVDVVAFRRGDVRLISIKSGGAYASAIEREALEAIRSDNWRSAYTVEIWRFPDRCRNPSIEVL